MGIFDRVRRLFAKMDVEIPPDAKATGKKITNDSVSYLIALSDFSSMDEEDIYEQLFIWEPEVGGSMDRISTMVGNSFKGFFIDSVDGKLDPSEVELVSLSNSMAKKIQIKNIFRAICDIGVMHGNVFIIENKDLSLSILPNKKCTLIDDKKRLESSSSSSLITTGTYLIVDEGNKDTQMIYGPGEFYHIKYSDTPVFIKDSKGRETYGVYSPSPLHRAIIPIWWKRQTEIIDILWRWRNVPREHHKIDAEMFSLDKYNGDLDTRRTNSRNEATRFVDEYLESIKNRVPDQGYATLSTVDIGIVEPKSSGYMNTNELIEQLSKNVWTTLNIPSSIVNGEGASSYASELMLSNYVTEKILEWAERIAWVVCENMKKRMAAVSPSYPVDNLDIKLELIMASTKLEIFRQAAIMAGMGVYTDTEIRKETGYDRLTEDQLEYVVNNAIGIIKTATNDGGDGTSSPETSHSRMQHPTDPGERMARKPETTVTKKVRGVS